MPIPGSSGHRRSGLPTVTLPPGATGFGSTTSSENIRAAVTACHYAARQTGGAVAETATPGVTPNFHTITIEYADRTIVVLTHGLLPLAAIAEPWSADNSGPITFIDRPDLATFIADASELEVLTRDQLAVPLSRADLTGPSPHEHHQVSYWKPAIVGELLFNFWD